MRAAFLAQIRADFGGEGKYRRGLFYLLLALPALLLPRAWAGHGLHSIHYDLGWPLPDVHVRIGGDGDGRMALHFLPELTLLFMAPLWCLTANSAWRARRWAKARPIWPSAFLQAALTSLYGALVVCFFYGVIDLAWTWRMEQRDDAGIEFALSFAWGWLPWLYVLGAVGIFVTLLLDSRIRPGFLWLAHFTFALGFAFAFRELAPYLTWQMDDLDSMVRLVQREQLEPFRDRPKIDARQLDKLQEIFDSTPRFGEAFWHASRRVANWRGLPMIDALMKRSRSWSDDEGSVFVPFVASLPQKSALAKLKHYQKSAVASERYWAGKYLAELEAADTKEAVRKYSRTER